MNRRFPYEGIKETPEFDPDDDPRALYEVGIGNLLGSLVKLAKIVGIILAVLGVVIALIYLIPLIF